MKIIVVSDVIGTRAGAYLATLQLCGELSRMGHDVTCFAATIEANSEVAETEFELVGPILEKGWRYDIPFRALAWQASRAIQKSHVGLVIAVGLNRLTRYLLQGSPARHVLVWELTNATLHNKFVDPLAISLLHRTRGILSPSKAIDQEIRSNYNYSGLIQRLPFWIEDQPTEPASCDGADFIFLGRRDPEKGLEELIRATASIFPDFPNVKVLVAGHGEHSAFADLADSLGVGSAIEFHTFALRDDAMRALSGSKCLVLPSYHEGYPLVLLEAARAGILIIASNVGSNSSMFKGCDGCSIVEPRDIESLARTMREVLIVPDNIRVFLGNLLRQHFDCHLSRHAAVAHLSNIVSSSACKVGTSFNPENC